MALRRFSQGLTPRARVRAIAPAASGKFRLFNQFKIRQFKIRLFEARLFVARLYNFALSL